MVSESPLSASMRADGWRDHDGDISPLPPAMLMRGAVAVILRDGRITLSRFGFWSWRGTAPLPLDIVAWFAGPDQADANHASMEAA